MLQLVPLLLLAAQEVELPETVIRAPRSEQTVTTNAAKVTVLTGEELRRTGQDSLPRAIGQAAGVWVQETNYGGGAPAIRGLLGNQILILVDGVRLNDSTTRFGPNQSLNTIDPAIVDRVEIIRGASSVKYGSDAIGGVISIWTKRRRPKAQDSETYYRPIQGEFGGTYNTAVEGGLVSLGLSSALQEHGLLLIGSLHDFSDLRSGGNEDVPNTGYHGQSIFGAYEYMLGEKQTLRLTGRSNRDFVVPRTDKLIPGFAPDGSLNPTADSEVWQYSLQDRTGYQISLTDEKAGDYVDAVQLRANFHSYREQRDRRSTGSTTARHEEDDINTLGLGVDWRKALSEDHLLTFGLDMTYDDVDSTRTDTPDGGSPVEKRGSFAPDSQYARAGIFVQDEVMAFDPWFLTLGLRYSYFDFSFKDYVSGDKESGSFDAVTASAELSRELGEGVTGTATLAQGFRAPNLDDLAIDGSFGGGDEIANPNLDPEQSLMAELAVEVKRSVWRGTFAVFATRIDDFISRSLLSDPDPGISGDETYIRENNGTVDLFGTELGLRRQLMGVDSPFSVDATVSYVYGTQDDPQLGNNIAAQRVPPLHGQFGLGYRPEMPFYQVSFARFYVNWADNQDRLHPNDVSDPRINPGGTAGWATYNLDFGGSINSDSDWWVGVYNISDTTYRVHASGFNAPGARLIFGVKVRI
jgi:hemoglobin/transferrin/lactoferrin receptor protein